MFRRGRWYEIALPFSDPMLTEAHLALAASVAVSQLVEGASVESAVAEAEKTMYSRILGISREEHNTPENEEK